jgi:hypothetical protein
MGVHVAGPANEGALRLMPWRAFIQFTGEFA